MNHTDLCTLTRHGDRWRLTFTRRLAHPREKVWRAVTEPEHLAAWYPQQIVGERKAGAPLRFVSPVGPEGPGSDGGDGGDGYGSDGFDGFDGQMLVFDPPSVMEFTWGPDLLRIELAVDATDAARTVLTLTDTFDDLGKAARDAVGWHECLDLLAGELDGAARPGWGETWRRVHPAYVTALGPEAATVGPPPGWEEHVRT
jgi:uncharacterized protein YndB with AHSA1/START domain